MCRFNQLWGLVLVAFGSGIWVGILLQGSFLTGCLGAGVILVGICLLKRK